MPGSVKPQIPLRTDLSPPEIREQLERILASETFARSERLSAFLRYVVEETLRGNGHTLKEQVIAHEVYGRGDAFDQNVDPVVRVDARRLRDKLREFYAGADGEPIFITLPKGSYVPAFESAQTPIPVIVPAPHPVVIPRRRGLQGRTALIAGVATLTVAAAVGWFGMRKEARQALRTRPLTISPGNKGAPSISPDGNFVVFAWSNDGPPDLYIKATDGESIRRLTETPRPEFSPAWSPDGRNIAFVRGGEGVFITSPLGGVERKIAEPGRTVGWSADSMSVFVNQGCPGAAAALCVYQITLETLQKRQITHAAYPGDWAFAASPDGRTLAIVRSPRGGLSDIYLVPLAGGDARRITNQNRYISSVAYTPDGKYLLYSVLEGMRFNLWRTAASGATGNGEPIDGIGESAGELSISRSIAGGGFRVVYQTMLQDVSLRLVTLNPGAPNEPIGTAMVFADTTEGRDCAARFSPDASQIVFNSIRSGQSRLWLANRDGSGLRSLTAMIGQEIKPEGWSPDGRRIAFSVAIDGNTDIYITEPNGTQPFRLTSEAANDGAPRWSPDGRWIYFSSDRSGSSQIWKAPAAGGSATQLTYQGGFQPQPSSDGAYIYYVGGTAPGSRRADVLKRILAAGGEESVVLETVHPFYWVSTTKGLYLLALEQNRPYVDRYDPDTGRRTRLGVLPFRPAVGYCGFMDVSQDGRFLIANHADRDESNLRLIEGLR